MEIINKSDEKLLAEYEQFASTSKYGNFCLLYTSDAADE